MLETFNRKDAKTQGQLKNQILVNLSLAPLRLRGSIFGR